MRYLGTSDDVTACDCCGKTRLKSTVAIEDASENVVYYGVTCAAKALRVDVKTVRTGTRDADHAKAEATRANVKVVSDAAAIAWRDGIRRVFGIELGSPAWFDLVSKVGFANVRAAVQA